MGDILVYPWTLSIWLLRINDLGTSVLDHRKRVVVKDELAQRKISQEEIYNVQSKTWRIITIKGQKNLFSKFFNVFGSILQELEKGYSKS